MFLLEGKRPPPFYDQILHTQDHKSRDLFVKDWGKTNNKTIFCFREMVLRRHQERLVSQVVG